MSAEGWERELRLFLEDLCCNLLRLEQGALRPGEIQREVWLGPGSFADIVSRPTGRRPWIVEVKHGYGRARTLSHLARKYGPGSQALPDAERLVVVVEPGVEPGPLEAELSALLRPGLGVEVWDEARVAERVKRCFDVDLPPLSGMDVGAVRLAMDHAKARYAFGDAARHDPLEATLLWHLDFGHLRALSAARGGAAGVLRPGLYKNVAVIFADLSSFSSFVRDTRDEEVVRNVLTSFYAKSRYQVLADGGMLYQFLGDGVVALFGVPEGGPGAVDDAFRCARSLLDIGASVMNEWQRHIDHKQSTAACHVGMALGDVSIVPLRPFSTTHLGAIAEAINVAARLTNAAGPDEIVAANSLHRRLAPELQDRFVEAEAVQARNVGTLQAWRFTARR